MYSSTLPSTWALDGGGWSTPRPGRFTPGKDPAGWAPEPVWTGTKNLAPTGIRSPDRPARSESPYRLSYPISNQIRIQNNYLEGSVQETILGESLTIRGSLYSSEPSFVTLYCLMQERETRTGERNVYRSV